MVKTELDNGPLGCAGCRRVLRPYYRCNWVRNHFITVIQLNGIPVPIRLSGTWAKPKVTPDMSGVTSAIQAELKDKLIGKITGGSGSGGSTANPLADILGLPGSSEAAPATDGTAADKATEAPAKPESAEDLAKKAASEALGDLLFGKKKTEDKPEE